MNPGSPFDRDGSINQSQATIAVLLLLQCQASAAEEWLRVRDSDGQKIARFEVRYLEDTSAYWGLPQQPWSRGHDGKWLRGQATSSWSIGGTPNEIAIVVRADGYAARVVRFDSAEDLKAGPVLTLEKGRTVQIELELPDGVKLPKRFTPTLYFPAMKKAARASLRHAASLRLNFSHPKHDGKNGFTVQVPEDGEFYVALQHVGWLRCSEHGPFKVSELVDDSLSIPVPEAGGIEVQFDTGDASREDLPFKEVRYSLHWSDAGDDRSYAEVKSGLLGATVKAIDGLAPGEYFLSVSTTPAEPTRGNGPNPGSFYSSHKVVVRAGQTKNVVVDYTPYSADAWRGPANARLRISRHNGQPAAGSEVAVTWHDPHYGRLTVFSGQVPESGVIELPGLSTAEDKQQSQVGPYIVQADGWYIGGFRLEDREAVQEFIFSTPPDVGDVIPDIEFKNLATGVKANLSDYRGKVTLLAVFAHPGSWGVSGSSEFFRRAKSMADQSKEVAFVPLWTDPDAERIRQYIANRGWDELQHYSCGVEADGLANQLRIGLFPGLPTYILLDRHGTIVGRSYSWHNFDFEAGVNQLLSQPKLEQQRETPEKFERPRTSPMVAFQMVSFVLILIIGCIWLWNAVRHTRRRK